MHDNRFNRNPFTNLIITTGTKDAITLDQFFKLEYIDPRFKRKPMYIHLDLSLNNDYTGIGGAWISGRKDIEADDGKIMSVLTFRHAFSLRVCAPGGDSIPYNKIVNFIVWLRSKGFNIAGISRDQFQSEYVGQQLESQGFNVSKLSLDRTPDGYLAFRSILLEQRIDLIYIEELVDELIHLQRDSLSGKVDHPVGGSKDISDGLAGAVWNAILENPDIPVDTSGAARAARAISSGIRDRNLTRPGSQLPSMRLGNRSPVRRR